MDRRIQVLSFSSPLGWIVIGSTVDGIGLLHVCGPASPVDAEIERIVRDEYPGASIESGAESPLLSRARDAVLRYLEAGEPIPPLPLDLKKGSPFQQEVWKALCDIPFGQTRTYRDIAEIIGRPRAVRAVGQGCGRNPVAILVPCHRVIAANGRLGGFSGGLDIKKALLELEDGGSPSSTFVITEG